MNDVLIPSSKIEIVDTDRNKQFISHTAYLIESFINIQSLIEGNDNLATELSDKKYCGECTYTNNLSIDQLFARIRINPQVSDFETLRQIALDIKDYNEQNGYNPTSRFVSVIGLPASRKSTLLRYMQTMLVTNPSNPVISITEKPVIHYPIKHFLNATLFEEYYLLSCLKYSPISIIDSGIWHRILSVPMYLDFDLSDPNDEQFVLTYLQMMTASIPFQPEMVLVQLDESLRRRYLDNLDNGNEFERRKYALEREQQFNLLYNLIRRNKTKLRIKTYPVYIKPTTIMKQLAVNLIGRIGINSNDYSQAYTTIMLRYTRYHN